MVAATDYSYDANSRLVALTHSDSLSATLAGYTWAYDHAGRLTDFTVAGYSGENATYTYDDTDQLVGADRDGTTNDESYTYDENGNRIGGGYTVGDNNQLLSDGTFNYTYDAEGNRLTKTEIATDYVTEYEWDYRNRLTAIIQKDDLGVVLHEVQYTYDIFNHRIVKTIDADGAGIGDPTQEIYIHDGIRQQRGNAGDHILLAFDEEGDLTHRYLHGPNVDQVLAAEEVTDPEVEGDVLWALTDHLGSVRDLAEYDDGTDTTTVVNHITYDAFGNITSETNAAVDFLFGFTGRERDAESDLQFNRARYYDAAIGRWISEDPIGFNAGDENLVRYVGNGPANSVDPSGLAKTEQIDKFPLRGQTIGVGILINTTQFTLGQNGSFKWDITWTLASNKSIHNRYAYILQKITFTVIVMDKDGNDITKDLLREGNPGTVREMKKVGNRWQFVFWEAWQFEKTPEQREGQPIRPQNIMEQGGFAHDSYDDTFHNAAPPAGKGFGGECTRGHISILGEYQLVQGKIPSSFRADRENREWNPPSGQVVSTWNDPAIQNGNVRKRGLSVKWDDTVTGSNSWVPSLW